MRPSAFLLLLLLGGCGSAAGDLASSAETVASWGATGRFVVTEWDRGSAPAGYVTDTLHAGEEEITKEEKAVRGLELPEARKSSVNVPAEHLRIVMGKLAAAVADGNRVSALALVREAEALDAPLRKIAAEQK